MVKIHFVELAFSQVIENSNDGKVSEIKPNYIDSHQLLQTPNSVSFSLTEIQVKIKNINMLLWFQPVRHVDFCAQWKIYIEIIKRTNSDWINLTNRLILYFISKMKMHLN